MIKKCSHCGAVAPDTVSAFCNRCGARLPAGLICHQCQNPVRDLHSRFCDRCGSALVPAGAAEVPPITLAKGRVCRACGYENFVAGAQFCRKCGSALLKGSGQGAPGQGPQEGALEPLREDRGTAQQEPVRVLPGSAQGQRYIPATVRQGPEHVPGDVPDTSRAGRWAAVPGGARRLPWKTVLVALAVILAIVILALVLTGTPGTDNEGAGNATAPGTVAQAAPAIASGRAPAINRATPVIVDTPLTVK